MSYEKSILTQIEDSTQLKQALKEQTSFLLEIAELMVKAFKAGHHIYLCGNGGSAADAQHIAGELAGKFYMDREPLPALALTTNSSILTAIGNDYSYDEVFVRQVRALVKPNDVLIGLSTSGNSKNVILAVEQAKRQEAITIAFVGNGGQLKAIADYCLSLPSNDTPRIQEAHITAGHIICYLVEQIMFGEGARE